MNDDPVDLRSLRTPPPLQPGDYAAVRAGVLAEIRRRERRRWIAIPLQVAAGVGALIVAAVLLRPAPEPPVIPSAVPVIPSAVPVIPSVSEESGRVAERRAPPPAQIPRYARNDGEASVATVPKTRSSSEPMRIHIQTADPEIRIIWIVAPQKEES